MKSSELKVGDWVSFEGKPFQIYDMTRQGDVVWYDEGASSVLMEEIEPIPLTEEILEKNGWKKVRINPFYTAYFEYKFVHEEKPTFYKKMDDKAIYHDFFKKAPIPYVHQLQHILWALGMDDEMKL